VYVVLASNLSATIPFTGGLRRGNDLGSLAPVASPIDAIVSGPGGPNGGALIYVGGRFIASAFPISGEPATITAYSDDGGETWGSASGLDGINIVQFAAIGDLVVAVGAVPPSPHPAPLIAVSTDKGTTWSTVSSFPVGNLMGIAASPSLFMACGFNGDEGPPTLMKSMDGVSWTAVPNPFDDLTDAVVNSVAYGGGMWVICTTYDPFASVLGAFAYSTDNGASWTVSASGTDGWAPQFLAAGKGAIPIRQFPRDDNLALGAPRLAGVGPGQPSSTQSSSRVGFRGTYS
jgi:hypothetical protein